MSLRERLQALEKESVVTERQTTYLVDNSFVDQRVGHIHHTGPLHILEAERIALFAHHRIDLEKMAREEKLYGYILEISIKYPGELWPDDLVVISSRVFQTRPTVISIHQKIARDGKTVVEAVVDAVMVDERGRPQPIPNEIIQKLRATP